MAEPIIQFEHFGFQYYSQSKPTLYDINLSIRRGEKILIAGPSGCGKSTLAHCINGLIPFSYKGEMTGSVKIGGKESKKQSLFKLSKTVGTVLQDSDGQFVGMTVAEDIAFALENDCIEDPQLHDRVARAAHLVHIEDHLHHAPNELSGGQKQRVALAGILVDDVDVLLFDEPLANLDPATGKEAIELIDEIQKETGAAVVIIEHRVEDVLWRSVDRIVLMQNGRILADQSPDELLCGDLLIRTGVREPLYLTTLKYAGVQMSPRKHPGSIHSLVLDEEDRKKVASWYETRPILQKEENRPVLLHAENIEFSYSNGFQALKKINACVRKGELLAIVGKNGAGKSTFSKVICGFEQQRGGKLTFDGQDLSGLSIKERAEKIGYVMQNPNQMISKVQIMDEVGLGLMLRGVPEEEVTRKAEETLKICGLYPFRKWPVSALSYGQKKRVTIASILSMEPDMIILDEPTAGQDYAHYTEIMEFLTDLNRRGITVVMITHDMHLMLEYAQRAIVFCEGQVIADDTGAGILTNPAIIEKANLKATSLYDLALRCGIQDARGFAQRFIDFERERRESEKSKTDDVHPILKSGNKKEEEKMA